MKPMKSIKIDKICTTPWSQARGLMFSRKKTLLFVFQKERYVCIHNWFVLFPITLIFLNKQKQVVEIKYLRPFSFTRAQNKAKYLIETPYPINITLNQKIEL